VTSVKYTQIVAPTFCSILYFYTTSDCTLVYLRVSMEHLPVAPSL